MERPSPPPHPRLTLTSPLRFPHTARRWRSGAPTVNSHPGSQRSCQSSQCVRGLSGRHYTHHFRPSISSVLHLPLPSQKPLHHVQLSTEPPVICIHPVLLRSDQEICRHYHKSLSGQLLNCKFFFFFFVLKAVSPQKNTLILHFACVCFFKGGKKRYFLCFLISLRLLKQNWLF